VVEEYCHAGSLQQAVQKGGMQRFEEDGIPQMVSSACKAAAAEALAAVC
jgi:hypothetical protein